MRLGAGPNFDCRSHRRGVPSFALVLRSRRWVLVSEERGALSSCGDRHRLAAEERRVTDEQLRPQLVFLRENEKGARARGLQQRRADAGEDGKRRYTPKRSSRQRLGLAPAQAAAGIDDAVVFTLRSSSSSSTAAAVSFLRSR